MKGEKDMRIAATANRPNTHDELSVGALIYNDNFDCNCNIEVYDCTEEGVIYGDGASVIYTNRGDRTSPSNDVLNMKVKYITTSVTDGTLIIEASR